ncbi:hypothetical protein B0H14DRAFT_1382352 [Mycena olivaceomarginata]|nr:hypothetical protein B0H14DRAFT_1382352 [Mycena olivaceomarginata]
MEEGAEVRHVAQSVLREARGIHGAKLLGVASRYFRVRIFALFPRILFPLVIRTPPDVVSRARAVFFRRLIFLRVCFHAFSPSDGAAYTYGQIPRGALVLGDPLSTTRARDKGCSFIFAGAVRIILWEGDVCCHRPTSTTTTSPLPPSSAIDLPTHAPASLSQLD